MNARSALRRDAPPRMSAAPTPPPQKGRGAISNADGRYERFSHVREDDSWGTLEAEDRPAAKTTVLYDASRSIIARNSSPDLSFDRSINPYRGCEHGCVYCFARPSHAWLGMSPGLDFETRLAYQADAAAAFVPVQRRLAARDAMNEWVTHVGSAVFAMPPGAPEGEYVGQGLLTG